MDGAFHDSEVSEQGDTTILANTPLKRKLDSEYPQLHSERRSWEYVEGNRNPFTAAMVYWCLVKGDTEMAQVYRDNLANDKGINEAHGMYRRTYERVRRRRERCWYEAQKICQREGWHWGCAADVLEQMLLYGYDSSICNASISSVAQGAGCCYKTAWRWIQRFKAAGVIVFAGIDLRGKFWSARGWLQKRVNMWWVRSSPIDTRSLGGCPSKPHGLMLSYIACEFRRQLPPNAVELDRETVHLFVGDWKTMRDVATYLLVWRPEGEWVALSPMRCLAYKMLKHGCRVWRVYRGQRRR